MLKFGLALPAMPPINYEFLKAYDPNVPLFSMDEFPLIYRSKLLVPSSILLLLSKYKPVLAKFLLGMGL